MDRRLEPYRALVPFLGQALGPDYEVALHDLTGETGAVAALANGGVTGQSLGAPLCGMAAALCAGWALAHPGVCDGLPGRERGQGAAAGLGAVHPRR